MPIRGVEPAVNALRQRIEDDLPANIAAINATVTDGTLIEDPVVVTDYVQPPGELVQFPSIGIEHGPGRWEDDTGYGATGVYDLIVVAFVQNADQQSLARYVRRYHLALTRTIFSTSRNLGSGDGIPWSAQVNGFDFGPALTVKEVHDTPPHTYMTWVAIAVRVKLDEF